MDKKGGWRRFKRLKFDSKKLSRRAKRAETLTTKHAHRFVIQKIHSIRDVRQHITGWLLIIGALIVAVALQMIWFQSGYRTYADVGGGTYAEGMLGPLNTLNPLYAQSDAEKSADKLIFSGIYDYDETGHLRSDLAQTMSVNKTGNEYTIGLRDDAKWQDGTKLTAEDVAFTVDLMKNPNARALMGSSWVDVKAEVIDTYHVKFILPGPYASFPHALTFAVLPKHILGSINPESLRENAFSFSPVGTGPFSVHLVQQAPGATDQKIVHLSAWSKYYRGIPKLARFEIHSYKTPRDILRAVRTRDVNAAYDIGLGEANLPRDMSTKAYPINSGVYALFNTINGPLKDIATRQALQRASDTLEVRKSLNTLSLFPPLDTPFIPSQIETVKLPSKPELSLSAAQKLFAQAGWNKSKDGTLLDKKKQQLTLRIAVLKDPEYHNVVEDLSSQWQSLGIKTQVVEFDPKSVNQSFAQAVLQPRAYDVLVNQLAIGADPDVYAYWHSSQASQIGLNFSNYSNPISDDALSSARVRSDRNLRDQKYLAFTKQWLKDVPAIGLYQSSVEYTHTNSTTAFADTSVLPSFTDRYANVVYWTADKAQVYKTP